MEFKTPQGKQAYEELLEGFRENVRSIRAKMSVAKPQDDIAGYMHACAAVEIAISQMKTQALTSAVEVDRAYWEMEYMVMSNSTAGCMQ